ncbi:restriction endonuclease subunit S [Anthocerotibacter panamensis]|uniref:restriction endonuclease subunit S n=1 Tax=Anthocerotibacter panamensis TaxID=2857077 RepID=UPI001C40775D|nr:restriction endonuclease subunit S [Anthocerotibacter panamensis]
MKGETVVGDGEEMSELYCNPWFGHIPVKWQQGQIKRFYSVRLGKMLQPNSSDPYDELIPYMRAANITWKGPDISDIKKMWASPKEICENQLEPGDLLVSEGGDVGRSCLWNGEIPSCIFQNAINRIRPRKQNSIKFLRYVMEAVKESGWIDILCNKATIAHFTAEKVNALEIPLPPLPEQHRIATYLDKQTEKIDQLIEM